MPHWPCRFSFALRYNLSTLVCLVVTAGALLGKSLVPRHASVDELDLVSLKGMIFNYTIVSCDPCVEVYGWPFRCVHFYAFNDPQMRPHSFLMVRYDNLCCDLLFAIGVLITVYLLSQWGSSKTFYRDVNKRKKL